MSEIAERYRKVARGFSECTSAVPKDAWDNPSPCEGWLARDVVGHMVEWMPGFFLGRADIEVPQIPSVGEDPAAAWQTMSDAIQAALDDPETAKREFEMRRERYTVEQAVDLFCISDVLIHTWDLARATGLDDTLDPDEVHRALEAMAPADDLMRRSGHYGTRTEVPDDADEQTRLLAFTGRRP